MGERAYAATVALVNVNDGRAPRALAPAAIAIARAERFVFQAIRQGSASKPNRQGLMMRRANDFLDLLLLALDLVWTRGLLCLPVKHFGPGNG